MDTECPVCFHPFSARTAVCVQPCMHRFCAECVDRIMCTSGGMCALCRGTIVGVADVPVYDGTRVITVGGGKYAGVTLTNATDGVRVVDLKPCDEAAKHLRVGDVITHLNGVAAIHHRIAVAQIDAATDHAIPLRVQLQRRRVFLLPFLLRRRHAVRVGREVTQRLLDARAAWTDGHTRA